MDTFHGLKVQSERTPPAKGAPEYDQLTWAIRAWRQAALHEQCSDLCEAAARELEIERDHGVVVHINRRTA